MSKFSQIPIHGVFTASGIQYRKLDDLYYVDLVTGFQEVWSPMFDNRINFEMPAPVANDDNITDKFIVDPQTRVMKANPNYIENKAEHFFAEMWGTGLFDCGPEEYDYLALKSIEAVKALSIAAVKTPAKKSVPAKKKGKK